MLSRLKPFLIDRWREAWKLWTVQINTIGLVLLGVVEFLREGASFVPPSLANRLPHGETIATVCFVIGIGARLIRQKKKAA